jgi:hypothetical protein
MANAGPWAELPSSAAQRPCPHPASRPSPPLALPLLAALLVALAPRAARAAPFTDGNYVALRVGRGGGSSAALTTAATATFLDEYTPAGALVQSLEMPVMISGVDLTSGTLSRSADGAFVTFAGVSVREGAPSVCGPGGTGVTNYVPNSCFPNAPRSIVRVDAGGNVAVTNISSSLYDGIINGVCTYDGTGYWAAGNATGTSAAKGVAYVPHGNGAAAASIIFVTGKWFRGCSVGGPSAAVVGSPFGNTLYLVYSDQATYTQGSGYAAFVPSAVNPVPGALAATMPPPTTGPLFFNCLSYTGAPTTTVGAVNCMNMGVGNWCGIPGDTGGREEACASPCVCALAALTLAAPCSPEFPSLLTLR